jgi:hypothetical protein
MIQSQNNLFCFENSTFFFHIQSKRCASEFGQINVIIQEKNSLFSLVLKIPKASFFFLSYLFRFFESVLARFKQEFRVCDHKRQRHQQLDQFERLCDWLRFEPLYGPFPQAQPSGEVKDKVLCLSGFGTSYIWTHRITEPDHIDSVFE